MGKIRTHKHFLRVLFLFEVFGEVHFGYIVLNACYLLAFCCVVVTVNMQVALLCYLILLFNI